MDSAAYRDQFPITQQYAYLNHAGISPMSKPVAEALTQHIAAVQQAPFDRLREMLSTLTREFKERAAAMINARSTDEVVPISCTAAGINTAALSLPLKPGDNVLVLDGDYPANIYPWMNLAPRGILVKWVPQHRGGLDLDRLEARIDSHTRAIALSSAMFATGFKNDLAAVGALCRARSIYFVVDAIQTLGAFPFDVQACNIDFLATGSQKWLLATPGSGFLYCRQELLPQLQLGAYVGSASVVDPYNYLDYNFTLQPTAERFNLGTSNLLGIVALHAAMGQLLEVGSAETSRRILALTDTLIEDLQRRGYELLSDLEPAHRSGIVMIKVDDPQAAYQRLLDAQVVSAVRGAGLRITPHFYNNSDDVLRVGEALGNRT